MPAYRRGYRRRFRRYRRYGRRYLRRRSYARRYVNGSSRSTIRMKCNQVYTAAVNAGYTDAATGAAINAVYPYMATASGLPNNALYAAYTQLYEETKLIGMKVALSVVSTVGGADIPSLQIYTTWDRRHGHGEAAPTVAEIKASANQTVATALNNNVAKITRSCYAGDLMEKAQWHDCSGSSAQATLNWDAAWVAAGANPNFFCPAFFFFFNCPSKAAVTSISYSMSITYYVAFRNPRYGGSASNRDLAVRSVTFADDAAPPADDGDMEDPVIAAADDALARIEAFRYEPDEPAGAAQAAAANVDAQPGQLGKRNRSNFSQENRVGEPAAKKN